MNSLKQIPLTPGSIVNNNNNNDTYCLRWTRHPNMLCAALETSSELSAEEPFLDLVFHLDDGSVVHLHSLVLAASSQYFSSLGKQQQETAGGFYHVILPETARSDLMLVVRFLYTGQAQVPATRLAAVTEIAAALGVSSLISALGRTVKTERREEKPAVVRSVSPPSLPTKRAASPLSSLPHKALKLESLPMLQSILTQFQLGSSLAPPFSPGLSLKEKDIPEPPGELGYIGADLKHHLASLQSLQSLTEHGERGGGSGGLTSSPAQLANILTAAAKLKQVAEQAIKSEKAGGGGGGGGGEAQRKLAFHEPRPCPVCRRMYRDAATLRTHTAIMHSEGSEPFRCSCGVAFGTKYEMYQHKKSGHPPVK